LINISNHYPGNDYAPTWSPDGRLAWSYSHRSDLEVFTWDSANGTQAWSEGSSPAWSTDGRLAWADSGEIYVWDSANQQAVNVSQNRGQDNSPAWSPDGRLAWMSNRDGNYEIYVWNPLSGELTNVTQHPADDSYPVWYIP